MKAAKTVAFGLLMALLAACSQTPDTSVDLGGGGVLALPGAPGNSYTNAHLFNYTGPGVPNGHRAEVFAKTSSGGIYLPDTFISTNAYFSVEMGNHAPYQVRVSVLPNLAQQRLGDPPPNPITCGWQGSTVVCSRSIALPSGTLFAVTVEELNSATNQWVSVSKAYFRTNYSITFP
jgi:hypothetical protein